MEQTMELLKKETKGKKMNAWKDYYIQYFTHQNEIIEKQICAKHNPLFQLAFSTHAVHHTADTYPSQLLLGNQASMTHT
jgi:hypothetical protein